ncbi:MAG: bifunctional aspartate transaminase/aspartate 4-decarboxylase [Bacteroidaceae bacterium]|nr:bifunctional aspartate transaminase/aspartate 4-decarboxylase [Bacteroidaceae bacterium]
MNKLLKDKSEVIPFDKEMEKISPFELKDKLISLADESVRKMMHTMLNAGRGNPNWVATVPREAFFLLGEFGLNECRRVWECPEGLAGIPQKDGIAKRFNLFIEKMGGKEGAGFLQKCYNYMLFEHKADADSLVHEWVEGAIGDQYPVPGRILQYTEIAVRDYIAQELCGGRPPQGEFDLFATEGGTAAMCYIFDSLQQNYLLGKGDNIALLTPVFTPYIEIPELRRYKFKVTHIPANRMSKDGLHLWQYDEREINRLRDTAYKAVFIVNPSNPPSYSLSNDTVAALVDIVNRWNPNLMIVTDDVYATYVPGFRSLIGELPHNTIGVYSFSKYFGATGWRTAVTVMHRDNIFDGLLKRLPRKRKGELQQRYGSIRHDVENMRFIDRMVADSRQVALNHTAGLSLPQQMQMSLFALYSIIDKREEDRFRGKMIDIIGRRLDTLWRNMGFTLPPDPLRAGYYSEIDLLVWAKRFYGNDFADYLRLNYNPLDVVFRLATETSLVVLNGGGFDGPEWSIRVSLANLKEEDYAIIGRNVRTILDSYADRWKKSLPVVEI